ncbi:DUF3667 domain-containing protein [Massilia sp. PWRC2]|uniref:DUF3667 domain-containing protein n=1 Tax=Massilia sp. PWRC2 TaxID=2804626 RepID=UPI003CFBB890
MTVDLESGGALVGATLAASSIDAAGGSTAAPAEHAHAHDACANCDARLSGPYCQRCGQSAHLHHSLLHLGEEFLHGLLHFDAKAWRTLPLLVFQPGRLTRNYIDGKRTRYVSPLALFLFMVFLMFFVVSSVTHVGSGGLPGPRNTVAADVAGARVELAGAEATLAAERSAGIPTDKAVAALAAARERLDDAESALTVVNDAGNGQLDKVVSKLRLKEAKIDTSFTSVDHALRGALDNPQLTLYKLKNAASKYSFMLVPMSLPFLWLLFCWKRAITMYDHAVFALYALSFMALLIIGVTLLEKVGLSGLALNLLWIAPPVHMFVQLRGTYRLGAMSALWRTLALLFTSLGVLVLYLLLILTVSVAM